MKTARPQMGKPGTATACVLHLASLLTCLSPSQSCRDIGARFALWFSGLGILVNLIGACATTELPSKTELADIEASRNTIVLVRIVVEGPDGKPIRPFANSLVDDNLGLAVGDFESGGVPTGRLERVRFLSNESRDQGWTYLVLQSGTYYLALQAARREHLSSYIARFAHAPRWFLDIPADVPIVYAGSLYLSGKREWLILGGDVVEHIDATHAEVRDERALALELTAKHLRGLGPSKTTLMERHLSDTFYIRKPTESRQ